jgi:small subunit ribosomal protein S20
LPAKAAPKKSKSVRKRARQTKKLTQRNRTVKNTLKTLTKNVESDVVKKDTERAKASLNKVIRAIDRARVKGVIHRNTAARKVSRLTRLVNSLSQSGAA